MFLKKFDGLVHCAKDKRALELIGTGFNTKNVISRDTHSVRRDRKSQSENDSGIIDPNLSMWRSINSEHKEVEQVPTDQTENIMNYYKDRWIQEHKERKNVETISGTEVSRVDSGTEKKSLYSQLARKAHAKGHNPMMGSNMGQTSSMGHMGSMSHMGSMGNMSHMGSMGPMSSMSMGLQSEDPSMSQYDPFKLQKTAPYSPSQEVDNKERFQNSHIRQTESVPGFWSSQRSPYNCAMPGPGQTDPQSQQRLRETKPQDPNGPYRPSFSMADLVGNKSDATAKTDKQESAPNSDMKPSKRFMSHDKTKEEAKDESNSSSSFKPAAPPVPDFKST